MSTFRFGELPMELQFMILRFTMPQHGLLPKSSVRLRHLHLEYRKALPSSLFRVSKVISTEARSIVQNEVYLVIDLSLDNLALPDSMTFLGKRIKGLSGFQSHLALSNIRHFKEMRNFEFDLMTDHVRPWEALEWDRLFTRVFIEQLRLICDTLAAYNDNIRHLKIRIPCTCGLKTAEMAHEAEIALLDFLAPLRRLRVNQPVIFHISHHNDRWHNEKLDSVRAEHLQHTLQTNLGQLVGEKLSKEEIIWKNIKAKDRTELTAAKIGIDSILNELLNTLDLRPENLERCVKSAEAYWYRQLRNSRNESGSQQAIDD